MEGLNNHNQQYPKVVVVMVPTPAQGHLNQLLHLSHLITTYGIPVHYAGSSTHNRQAKVRLQGWDPETLTKIQFHDFQLPSYNSFPPNIDLNDTSTFPQHLVPLFEASTHLRHPVSQLLQQLSENFDRVVVIHDIIMANVIQDVKILPNAEVYTFNPISAFATFVQTWETIPEEHKPFWLHSNDVPDHIPKDAYMCMSREMMEFIGKQFKLLGLKSGWIYNTSRVIEGRYVQLIETLHSIKEDVKHFALGPFNPVEIETKSVQNRHCSLEWLDEQEKNSVIYVSCGSTVSQKDDQIDELAKGLEKSGVKFIWVLRGADPNDVFEGGDEVIRPNLLEGYEERVKGRGMVVRDWAPQLEILAHSSVGGFMSHCGWNSCMESISMGVPIVAWPMHSDQPRNAVLISEVLKIGMVVRKWSRGSELVMSSTIENAVKTLMASEEGKEMKERAAKLSEEVKGSVVEGGVSCSERDAFIAYITR